MQLVQAEDQDAKETADKPSARLQRNGRTKIPADWGLQIQSSLHGEIACMQVWDMATGSARHNRTH